MKICRFNQNRLGVVLDESVADVSEALSLLPAPHYPLPQDDLLVRHLPEVMARIQDLLPHAPRIPTDQVQWRSPVANPGKIIAAPVNYSLHLQEVLNDRNLHHDNQINHIQRAGLFLKANSSLVDACEGITLNQADRRTDHEIELVIVMGRRGKNIAPAEALAHVAGYCVGLDITIRGPEERSLRKSPDSYTLIGPWLTTADEVPDPGARAMQLHVDGELRQDAHTSDLILGVAELIAFASRFYTLHPGDLIFTGTPQGVGPLAAGQRLRAHIQGLGTLQTQVRA